MTEGDSDSLASKKEEEAKVKGKSLFFSISRHCFVIKASFLKAHHPFERATSLAWHVIQSAFKSEGEWAVVVHVKPEPFHYKLSEKGTKLPFLVYVVINLT